MHASITMSDVRPGNLAGVPPTPSRPLSRTSRDALASRICADHYDAVVRYFRSRVADHETAEELAGDVFCKALAALPSYRPLRGTALPWLYTIAAHRLSDHYRRRRPTVSLEVVGGVPDSGRAPAEVVESREMVQTVWRAAERLPASQREALWLRFGEDRDYPDIARRLGRSVEAVKLLVHRGAKTIRARLQDGSGLEPDRRIKGTPAAGLA